MEVYLQIIFVFCASLFEWTEVTWTFLCFILWIINIYVLKCEQISEFKCRIEKNKNKECQNLEDVIDYSLPGV